MTQSVYCAVEGLIDESVAKRLILHAGGTPGPVFGKMGKNRIKRQIVGYNNAARHGPWFVLVDLDGETSCAADLKSQWLETPAPMLCFRVAVQEVESWLLADPEKLASFLGVAESRIPGRPDEITDPKGFMVNLASKSHRRAIREDMVPRPTSRRATGAAYDVRLIEYVSTHWRPEVAKDLSRSLAGCIRGLERMVET